MGAGPSIGIDDDLATGEAGVAVRTADFKPPGRVDVNHRLVGDEAFRQHLVEHAHHIVAQFLIQGRIVAVLVIAGRMLRRHHQGNRLDRHFVDIAQSDLALAVGLQKRCLAAVAVIGHLFQYLVRIMQRRRHQFRRLVTGIAEHDPLVPGAFILVSAFIDALGDMRRLRVQVVFKDQILPVEAVLLIADFLDRFADRGLDFFLRSRWYQSCPCREPRLPARPGWSWSGFRRQPALPDPWTGTDRQWHRKSGRKPCRDVLRKPIRR